VGWFIGNIPASAATYACNFIQSNWSWRIPLILQVVCAGITCVGVFFVPESPRWLMANGREQEALDFLTKYHGAGNVKSPLVEFQYREFKAGISQTGSDKKWWDCECGS
jgi:MFS family permease